VLIKKKAGNSASTLNVTALAGLCEIGLSKLMDLSFRLLVSCKEAENVEGCGRYRDFLQINVGLISESVRKNRRKKLKSTTLYIRRLDTGYTVGLRTHSSACWHSTYTGTGVVTSHVSEPLYALTRTTSPSFATYSLLIVTS